MLFLNVSQNLILHQFQVPTFSLKKKSKLMYPSGHAAGPCSVDMQYRREARTCAWTHSMKKQQRREARTCSMDIQQDHAAQKLTCMHSYTHTCIYTEMYMYVYIHVHVHTCTGFCKITCTYIHILYVCIYLLFWTIGSPIISGSIRSIKMYSWA